MLTALVSNLCGLSGAILLAFSLHVSPSRGKEVREAQMRSVKKGKVPMGFCQIDLRRFRVGLGLIGVSYLLPWLIFMLVYLS